MNERSALPLYMLYLAIHNYSNKENAIRSVKKRTQCITVTVSTYTRDHFLNVLQRIYIYIYICLNVYIYIYIYIHTYIYIYRAGYATAMVSIVWDIII